jgi:hypothetical protein
MYMTVNNGPGTDNAVLNNAGSSTDDLARKASNVTPSTNMSQIVTYVAIGIGVMLLLSVISGGTILDDIVGDSVNLILSLAVMYLGYQAIRMFL